MAFEGQENGHPDLHTAKWCTAAPPHHPDHHHAGPVSLLVHTIVSNSVTTISIPLIRGTAKLGLAGTPRGETLTFRGGRVPRGTPSSPKAPPVHSAPTGDMEKTGDTWGMAYPNPCPLGVPAPCARAERNFRGGGRLLEGAARGGGHCSWQASGGIMGAGRKCQGLGGGLWGF